jgi:threonine dehydratase
MATTQVTLSGNGTLLLKYTESGTVKSMEVTSPSSAVYLDDTKTPFKYKVLSGSPSAPIFVGGTPTFNLITSTYLVKLFRERKGPIKLHTLMDLSGSIPCFIRVTEGNVHDVNLLDRIIEKGLAQTRRLFRMSILLRDDPGALSKLTSLVAHYRANILHIVHERAAKDIPIGFSKVILVLETRGSDHISEIKKGLKEKGYLLQMSS